MKESTVMILKIENLWKIDSFILKKIKISVTDHLYKVHWFKSNQGSLCQIIIP